MKKIHIRVWPEEVSCSCDVNLKVEVYLTTSDFYEACKLYICPNCFEIFALDPDRLYYSGKKFADIVKNSSCPNCNNSFENLLAYPKNYFCSKCKKRHILSIPLDKVFKDEDSVVKLFYDLLS